MSDYAQRTDEQSNNATSQMQQEALPTRDVLAELVRKARTDCSRRGTSRRVVRGETVMPALGIVTYLVACGVLMGVMMLRMSY